MRGIGEKAESIRVPDSIVNLEVEFQGQYSSGKIIVTPQGGEREKVIQGWNLLLHFRMHLIASLGKHYGKPKDSISLLLFRS